MIRAIMVACMLMLSTQVKAELECLREMTNMMYREARGTSDDSLYRVGSVMINRAINDEVSVCQVLSHRRHWARTRVRVGSDYAHVKSIARKLLIGEVKPVFEATHFHQSRLYGKLKEYRDPKTMKYLGEWEGHVYYQELYEV